MKKVILTILCFLFVITGYAGRPGFVDDQNSNVRNGFVDNSAFQDRGVNHYDSMGRLIGYSIISPDGNVKEYNAMGQLVGSSR